MLMVWPSDHDDRFITAFRGASVCVTGGAGFIGAHLVHALLKLGAAVTVLDDLSGATSARLTELLEQSLPGSVRFIHASILEPKAVAEAVCEVGIVFHLAAVASAMLAQEEPVRCMEVNALGTARIAEAARKAGAERLIYAGSASAYGDTAGPNREAQAPRPLSPYAASKLGGEHVVAAWAASRGLDGAILRFFNVFGVGQSPESEYAAVIPRFAMRLSGNLPLVIYGDGGQTRDFVHVHDVVTALLLAGSSDTPLKGATINIGAGRSVSIAELARLMARLCGSTTPRLIHEPARVGDIRESSCDPSTASAMLGFESVVTLEEGLKPILAACPGSPSLAV